MGLSQGQITSFTEPFRARGWLFSPSSESMGWIWLSKGASVLIWKKLLTALVSARSRRSRPPSGCTFPWDTTEHLGDIVVKTGELQQPRLRNRPKDMAAVRGLPAPEGKGPGLGPAPSVLPKATVMGEGQAVPWGWLAGDGGALVPV